MTFNIFNQLNELNVNELNDMTKVQTGKGGSRGLLPVGTAYVRPCMYVEFGSHIQEFGGQKKPAAPIFKLGFRIVGGGGLNQDGQPEKYVTEDGHFPLITTWDTPLSLYEKSKAVKYFNALNRVGNRATHFVQKIQEQSVYALPIGIKKSKAGKDYQDIDFSNLQPALHPETFQPRTDLPQLESKHIQVFLWSHPTPEMWDTIFIEGQWDAVTDDTGKVIKPARSKNWLQEKCISAVDFEGSALQTMLQEQGANYTIPELATEPETQPQAPQAPQVPQAPQQAPQPSTAGVITPPEVDF